MWNKNTLKTDFMVWVVQIYIYMYMIVHVHLSNQLTLLDVQTKKIHYSIFNTFPNCK